MPIIRMINTREPGALREFQSKMAPVGKIRLGTYNGRYPEKLSTFRFTSEDEAKVRAAAAAYGGTAEPWTPQGAKTPQWEVISDAKAIPVYIVNGQNLDPWYEAWAGGRTCVRRCDGVTNKVTNIPCVCIPADGSAPRLATKDLCKPTIRVQVMLVEVPGLGSWLMESHGENACSEISTFGPFVAGARTQVPAVLRLREENRREWNPDKKGGPGFESKSFYVPWFDISEITMQQVVIGGDALTRALQIAGGSAALSGPAAREIEAAPAPVVATPAPPSVVIDIEGVRPLILADIELQDTVEGLNAIRDKLKAKGINDQKVIDAWLSKMGAVQAAAGIAAVHRTNEAAIASGVEATRTALNKARTDLGMEPPPPPVSEPEYQVGATVTVGGIEFTKISDDPFPPAEAVEGTVEAVPGRVTLPDVPEGDYDADELYAMLMTGASQQMPPLTTAELNRLITGAYGLAPDRVSQISGYELARLRAGLKSGAVSWR